MKLPKDSLYRRIRKIRASEYRRGRADNQFENDRLIEQLRKERDTLWNTYQVETTNLHAQYKKQMQERENVHKDEIVTVRKEEGDARARDREQCKGHLNNLKTEAMKKIANVTEKAKKEVERASQRETEYQQLIQRAWIVLAEAMAKLKVYSEEQQNMMGNIANQLHRSNEIEKIYNTWTDMNKNNAKLLSKLKIGQLEVEAQQ